VTADLSVGLSDSADPVAFRGEVTYTVTVANAGSAAAAGAGLEAQIRGGRIVSISGAQCRKRGPRVTCGLGAIAAGDSEQVTIVVRARRKALTATATVSSATSDPSAANNSDTETTQVAT
jgi:hypothetical protein